MSQPQEQGALAIGVDVGGTFTDLVVRDSTRNRLIIRKVPTTPEDQSLGFLNALDQAQVPLRSVESLVHGSTIGTNAVLERKGVRCGLITSSGFRDVLELGRRTRPNAWGLTGTFDALIPRELRREIPERLDASGGVVIPLDEAAVAAAVDDLMDMQIDALVICFCLLYTSPSPRDVEESRMPSSA